MTFENNNNTMTAYAKAAISGATLLNSGALLGILSQLTSLSTLIAGGALRFAITLWTIGITVGTISWILAYMATASFGHGDQDGEERFIFWGFTFVAIAIATFAIGMFSLAYGFHPPIPKTP